MVTNWGLSPVGIPRKATKLSSELFSEERLEESHPLFGILVMVVHTPWMPRMACFQDFGGKKKQVGQAESHT